MVDRLNKIRHFYNVMIEIRPIKDLRDTSEISKLCEESKYPIFITKNGYGHLFVICPTQ